MKEHVKVHRNLQDEALKTAASLINFKGVSDGGPAIITYLPLLESVFINWTAAFFEKKIVTTYKPRGPAGVRATT